MEFFFLISFCWLTAVARTSNTMLKRSHQSGHPCLLPKFSRKAFSFYVDYGLVINALYYVEICSFYIHFNGVLIMIGCYVFKCFLVSTDIIVWILSLHLLMWFITLTDFRILNHPCIPETNLSWSWYMVLFIYCWIMFAKISLRDFFCTYIHQRYWLAISCSAFSWFWYRGNCSLIQWIWKIHIQKKRQENLLGKLDNYM